MSEEERIAERLKDGDSVRRLAAVEGFDLNALLVAVKDEERKRFLTYNPCLAAAAIVADRDLPDACNSILVITMTEFKGSDRQ